MNKELKQQLESDINEKTARLQLADKIETEIHSVESIINTLKENGKISLEDLHSVITTFINLDANPVLSGSIKGSIIKCLEEYKDSLYKQYELL